MNSLVVKAICRRIEDRYGSNRAAAMAAGVSQGRWSHYCSDDYPDTTIPFHRALLVANTQEKAAFAQLLLLDAGEPPADVTDEACDTLEASADLQRRVRLATRDGSLTPREKKGIRDDALAVQERAGEVIAAAGAA